jgi:predicted transcriptional regulator
VTPLRYRPTRSALRALLADGCAWSVRELADVGRWNEGWVARNLYKMRSLGIVRRVGWTGWRIGGGRA